MMEAMIPEKNVEIAVINNSDFFKPNETHL